MLKWVPDSSRMWLLGQFTGLEGPSEVRSLTLRGLDRLVPVSIPFWITCDLVCFVRLPRYFWNGFFFSCSWKAEPSALSVWLVCWSGHCCCAVMDSTGESQGRTQPETPKLAPRGGLPLQSFCFAILCHFFVLYKNATFPASVIKMCSCMFS